jgi:hypothetical protein
VSTLVVGDTFLVGTGQEKGTLGAEHDLLQCIEEVDVTDLVLLAPGRQQRRLVDQVLQVRPRKPRRRGGKVT